MPKEKEGEGGKSTVGGKGERSKSNHQGSSKARGSYNYFLCRRKETDESQLFNSKGTRDVAQVVLYRQEKKPRRGEGSSPLLSFPIYVPEK